MYGVRSAAIRDWSIEKISLNKKDYIRPHTYCVRAVTHIFQFPSHLLALAKLVNRKAVFVNKCAGGSAGSLHMLIAMPLLVSKNIYTTHLQEINTQALVLAEESMMRARDEVHYFMGQ